MLKLLASSLLSVAVYLPVGLASAQSHPAINFDADNIPFGFIPDSWEGNFPGESPSFYWDTMSTNGWSFDLLAPATLTHLAMYDYGGDGLQGDFRVGLWKRDDYDYRAKGDFVVEGTVLGGVEAPLDGSWRLVDVEDRLLTPGHYTIGARYTSDQNEIAYSGTSYASRQFFCGLLGASPEECEEGGVKPDAISGPLPETVEYQFFWNFGEPESDDYKEGVPNDTRVDVSNSGPLNNQGRYIPGMHSYGDFFSQPRDPYLVTGAFIGPNLFFAPAPVPEPATSSLLFVGSLFFARARRRRSPA